MFAFFRKWAHRLVGGTALLAEHRERAKAILRTELEGVRVDGKPVTHRSLESLMQMAGTSRGATKRLLREIGARPSRRVGKKLWTLRARDRT